MPSGQEQGHATTIAEAIAAQAPLTVKTTLTNAHKAPDGGPDAAVAEFDTARLLEVHRRAHPRARR